MREKNEKILANTNRSISHRAVADIEMLRYALHTTYTLFTVFFRMICVYAHSHANTQAAENVRKVFSRVLLSDARPPLLVPNILFAQQRS